MRRSVNWWKSSEPGKRPLSANPGSVFLEPEADADNGVVITFLRNDAVRSRLGVLQIIPDKRSVQSEMPLDLVFQRGDRVMSVLARFWIGKGHVQRLDERKPLGYISAET